MGMYDDISLKEGIDCIKCGSKITYFQTKDFDSLLDNYVEGEDVSLLLCKGDKPTLDFDCHTFCDKCKTWVDAKGKIEKGIFTGLYCYQFDVKKN